MIMSRHPNSGQNQNIRIANESFENMAKFKYLGMALINQNDIRNEIKSRLNSGNVCYYTIQNLFAFSSHIKKPKCKNIQNCNFASCAVWVRNLVPHFVGGTQSFFLRTEC
jgi:hypothetical protein